MQKTNRFYQAIILALFGASGLGGCTPDDDASTSGDDSATTKGDADSGGNEVVDINSLCAEYVDNYEYCTDYSYDYYYQYCLDAFSRGAQDGADCTAALEDYYACLGTADCSEFDASEPCADEANATDARCPNL